MIVYKHNKDQLIVDSSLSLYVTVPKRLHVNRLRFGGGSFTGWIELFSTPTMIINLDCTNSVLHDHGVGFEPIGNKETKRTLKEELSHHNYGGGDGEVTLRGDKICQGEFLWWGNEE